MSEIVDFKGRAADASALQMVPLALIDVGERLRPHRNERVETLRKDIDLNGLNAPITLVAKGARFALVCGHARLLAVTALGHGAIEAKVLPEETPPARLRFAAAMDNINVDLLTKLERAEHLAEIKAAWEAMNPAARHGGDRRSKRVRLVKDADRATENQSAVFALCSDVAEKTGLSRRSFFLAIEIARNLTPDVKARIRKTWIEDHQATLQALAKEDGATQVQVCDLLLADPAKAGTVAEALTLIAGRKLPSASDKLYANAISTWSRLPKAQRAAFLDQHKREVLAHVRAAGWVLE